MGINKKLVNHYGCSFTQNIRAFHDVFDFLSETYIYENYGRESANNKYILDKFKETAQKNSISVIQWSSLTRPFDDNHKLLETSDNPLYDLLEEWYLILEDAVSYSIENNIKLIQYIGWAEWVDAELTQYHKNKLNSFGITWFTSKEQTDIIQSNCFQFQSPEKWSSNDILNGNYRWPELDWGGMAEWIRENIKRDERYIGYNHNSDRSFFDPHPSEKGTTDFIKQFLIKEIDRL